MSVKQHHAPGDFSPGAPYENRSVPKGRRPVYLFFGQCSGLLPGKALFKLVRVVFDVV